MMNQVVLPKVTDNAISEYEKEIIFKMITLLVSTAMGIEDSHQLKRKTIIDEIFRDPTEYDNAISIEDAVLLSHKIINMFSNENYVAAMQYMKTGDMDKFIKDYTEYYEYFLEANKTSPNIKDIYMEELEAKKIMYINELKAKKQKAIESQDYMAAAKYRDLINSLIQ